MKKNPYQLVVPFAAALLFATTAAAAPGPDADLAYTNHVVLTNRVAFTNRLSLSLRFGLNISTKFKGIGGSLQASAPAANGRRTREGDLRNYDDGYVLTDISDNAGDLTWYWGYDDAAQVSGNQILMHRTTAPGLAANRDNDDPNIGVELTYNREWGIKEDWHNLRYGIEGAANYLPICLKLNDRFTGDLSRRTDAYDYFPGTTPPAEGYEGSFEGPGFVIGSIPSSSIFSTIAGATVVERDRFEANLWGFRLGPYAELPINERLSLHASAGLALGLLDSDASWRQTISIPGEGTTTFAGGSHRFSVLWGYYVSASASWQLNERWNIAGGVQFQNLGKYREQLGLRKVEVDLSHSLFVLVGIGYSF